MSLLAPGAKPTVLAVDDDPVGRDSLAQLLRGSGFLVWEAATGGEAYHLLQRDPDVVLLDVQLPDTNGFEVCRRIKSNPATAITPVLMISGYAISTRDRVQGLEGGADAYLTKPLNPDELIAYLHTLLRVREFEEKAIAARKQAEAERALLKVVLDTLPVGVWVLDKDGHTILANPAGKAIWGGDDAHNQIENCHGRWHDSGVRIAPDELAVRRALRDGERALNEVIDIECPDGGKKTVRNSAVPVRDTEGQIMGAVAVNEDITERLRLEARYLQAQKMEAFGQLAGGIAHDFNNLLTVIIGCSDMLQVDLPPSDPCRSLAEEIQKAGERAASLTRQLLAFSRKQFLAPKVLDLNTVVSDMEKMLRRVLSEDVMLAAKLDPHLGRVRADPAQLEQVIMNLAVNARDAMPQGGKLTIETQNVELGEEYARGAADAKPGHYIMLAVSDTGTGMSAEIKGRIFEPFFTTKGPAKGTGLGLATVYGIVKQSGGHIEVYSEEGRGTTFKIYLPRTEAPLTNSGGGPLRGRLPGGNETILLVEDNDEVRALSQHILTTMGFKVFSARDAREALDIFQHHRFGIDLLVTDVVMPGIGGPDLARRLQALRPELKVLFVSGYTEDAVVRHGVLEGKVNFLQKPFTPLGLAQKIRAILDRGLKEVG